MNNSRSYTQIIGKNPPDIVSSDIQQHFPDTCAIKSQQLILEHFGVHIPEEQLRQEAINLQIYSDGQGTPQNDVGKLLELHGVHCSQHEHASIFDLTAALARGEQVIIGVSSGDLWNPSRSYEGDNADHALIVAGIDTTDRDHPQVILTDPGTGQEGIHYPLQQFLDAWHGSDNFMVTTEQPAPLAYNPQMINFDYNVNHLPLIGQMPFNCFNDIFVDAYHQMPFDPLTYDLFYNNFDMMMNADIMAMSPEFQALLHNIPNWNMHQETQHYFNPTHEPSPDTLNPDQHASHPVVDNSSSHVLFPTSEDSGTYHLPNDSSDSSSHVHHNQTDSYQDPDNHSLHDDSSLNGCNTDHS